MDYIKNYGVHIIFEWSRELIKYLPVNKIPIHKLQVLKYCQGIFSYEEIIGLKSKYYSYLDGFYKKGIKLT
jgi:hypothetical protein